MEETLPFLLLLSPIPGDEVLAMTGFRSRQLSRIRARKQGTNSPYSGLYYPPPSNATSGFATGSYVGMAQPVGSDSEGESVGGYGKSGATQAANRRKLLTEKIVTWTLIGALAIGGLIVVNKYVLKR